MERPSHTARSRDGYIGDFFYDYDRQQLRLVVYKGTSKIDEQFYNDLSAAWHGLHDIIRIHKERP